MLYLKEIARTTFDPMPISVATVLLAFIGSIIFDFDKVIEIWKNRIQMRAHKASLVFSILFLLLSMTTVLLFTTPLGHIPIPGSYLTFTMFGQVLFAFAAGLLLLNSFYQKEKA